MSPRCDADDAAFELMRARQVSGALVEKQGKSPSHVAETDERQISA